MTRRKRLGFQESPSAPKSPRLRQDAKIDSAAAAARGSSPATDGPRHSSAASTQVRHPPQPASIPTPRTPQRQLRGPAAATASVAHRRAASAATPRPAPPSSSPLAAAHTRGPLDPRPPPPSSALTAARRPLHLRQQVATAETVSSSAAPTPSLQDGCSSPSTPPPPARAHVPWSSIGGTSGLPYSFAYAVTRGANRSPDVNQSPDRSPVANQSPGDNLVQRFCDYLNSIPRNTANDSNKGQIITVTQTEILVLEIVEKHLDEHDSELAYAVFHSQDRFEELLYPAVSQFLISKGIVNNAVGGMKASFYTMPPSTKTLEDFIREQGSLVSIKSIFDGNFKLCVASDIGMMLVHGFLVYILNIHKQGRTWNGGFSTGDMVVDDCLKCRITNKITVKGNSDGRAEDLRQIADIFKPLFTINEEMALYFDVLDKDLRADIEAKWYREYLLSHAALKSSIARYNLECGLHAALKSSIARYNLECGLHRSVNTTKSNDKPIPSVMLEGCDWGPFIPREITEHTPCTDYSLYKVYWYNQDPHKCQHPYAHTVRGLLAFKRNFLYHGIEHIKVQDHAELEQFAAKTFQQALPNVLRGLLSRCEMNGPFKDHWEAYCSSRVGNDGNTEWRTGIRISFC